jgi:hypothetical protein
LVSSNLLEAHSTPEASNHCEIEVIRSNPCHPIEGSNSGEQSVGNPKP